MIASFDIDGVIYMGVGMPGLRPGPHDIIITGRSFEERPETERMLLSRGICNPVFYNALPFDRKRRESSGEHKADVLNKLYQTMMVIPKIHFEDDEVQAKIIEERCPWIKVVRIVHELVNKENVRHT